MKRFLIAAALMGTTAVGGFAYAAQTPPASKPLKGDTNADGQISRAEFIAQAQAKFAAMDTDKNGAISREERRAAHADRGGRHGKRGGMGGPFEPVAGQDAPAPAGRPGVGKMLERLDTNADGRITRAEYAAQAGTRFARMDANGDGTVDKTEMAAMRGGGRGMARIDADGNGTLTRAEFDKQSETRFARIDSNGDGVIDAAERAAIGNAMRQGRGGKPPRMAPTPPPAAPTGA
ncbi:hypothetical protein M9980_04710 [Sphingomonas donggukensis]|uniref:EF-hand domain-containing protein n=1 Tax=Sphingomonas donggukensis TaxID=2949093 RepID=A0ABY4TW14_9SPHN|nr:hypothetical protein [Sphingomonas donggukensis]URW76522.1 hypothetical protein M9980_04710 [Sphingomonas donggukensis]